jgi:hypothetical protein
MDGARPHVQVLGDVMLDKMVENDREPQSVGDALCDPPCRRNPFLASWL